VNTFQQRVYLYNKFTQRVLYLTLVDTNMAETLVSLPTQGRCNTPYQGDVR